MYNDVLCDRGRWANWQAKLAADENLWSMTGPRIPSVPFISGDGFRYRSNHVIDLEQMDLNNEVRPFDMVFVSMDAFEVFKTIAPKIDPKVPLSLIFHNSDMFVASTAFSLGPNVTSFAASNGILLNDCAISKCELVPIGIENRMYGQGRQLERYATLLAQYLIAPVPRTKWLLLSFTVGTNSHERSYCKRTLQHQPFVTTLEGAELQQFVEVLQQHRFILCPAGNGADTHRAWEAMLFGTICITRHGALDSLYSQLPIVIVDRWEEVTLSAMRRWYDELSAEWTTPNVPLHKLLHFEYRWERLLNSRGLARADAIVFVTTDTSTMMRAEVVQQVPRVLEAVQTAREENRHQAVWLLAPRLLREANGFFGAIWRERAEMITIESVRDVAQLSAGPCSACTVRASTVPMEVCCLAQLMSIPLHLAQLTVL